MFPEDLFTALGVAGELGGVVLGLHDQLAELHVVEIGIPFADVEEVDAGFRAVFAVEDDFHFGPVLVAFESVRLGAADVIIKAGFAAKGVRFDPRAEFVVGVRFQGHIGEEAGVGVVAGDDAEAVFATVDHLFVDDDAPLRSGIARSLAILTMSPAHGGFLVGGEFFKAGVRQQIGAFFVVQGLVLLAEHLGGFRQPFVVFDHGIAGELFDERFDLLGRGEVRELHEGREAGVQIGIGEDTGAEEEILRGFVTAESTDGVAAEFGVFGDEGGLV